MEVNNALKQILENQVAILTALYKKSDSEVLRGHLTECRVETLKLIKKYD